MKEVLSVLWDGCSGRYSSFDTLAYLLHELTSIFTSQSMFIGLVP